MVLMSAGTYKAGNGNDGGSGKGVMERPVLLVAMVMVVVVAAAGWQGVGRTEEKSGIGANTSTDTHSKGWREKWVGKKTKRDVDTTAC